MTTDKSLSATHCVAVQFFRVKKVVKQTEVSGKLIETGTKNIFEGIAKIFLITLSNSLEDFVHICLCYGI